MRFLILAFILTVSFSASGEYRVFQLRIGPAKSPNYRLVLSNLDPEQYVRYYPISATDVIDYVDTWMCRGATENFKEYCPNPRSPASAAPGSSQGPP